MLQPIILNPSQKKYKLSEKGQVTQKKYYQSLAKKQADRRWRLKNKEKTLANNKLNRALAKGILERKVCEVSICKAMGEAHHEDYRKPLEVIWLCHLHHAHRHYEIRKAR